MHRLQSTTVSKILNIKIQQTQFTNDSMSVFYLHRFALSTNPRIIPAEISRYRLLSMSVSLISQQPMKLQISFGFARAMPTTNPRTGMLWERDCLKCKNYFVS